MLKSLLSALLVATMFFTNGYSQSFVLMPTGLRDSADTGKSFLVLKFDSLTAKQLYDNAIKYINKTYTNPDQVIKGKTENEYLRYITHVASFIMIKSGLSRVKFDADYTVELNFKEGKVRYEITSLDMENSGGWKLKITGGGFAWYIYNKNGELKKEDAKKDIEQYFNYRIKSLTETLNGRIKENW